MLQSLFSYFKNKAQEEIVQSGVNISFTAHKVLDNSGPTIEVKEPLSVGAITDILTSIKAPSEITHRIITSIENDPNLNDPEFLRKLSGVYVHNCFEGLVMIKGTNSESDRIVSIQV